MSRFTINIFSNNSGQTFIRNIGPIAEHVRVTTVLPGGCGTCSFRVPHPVNFTPNYVGANYRVDVADEQGIFWAGRMERFEREHTAESGDYWTITAVGYYANGDDQLYTSQDVGGQALNTVITNAISNLMPQIGATSITNPSHTLSGATAITLRMSKGAKVLAWVDVFGNSANSPQIRHVYPDPDRTIRLTWEPRPTTATVLLSLRQMRSHRFGFDLQQFADQVSIQYNGGGSFLVSSSSGLQSAGPVGINLVRDRLLVLDEITSSGDARKAADSELERRSNRRMRATSIVLNPDAMPTTDKGAPIPLWRVRSRYIARITDINTIFDQNSALTAENSFLIVGTEYDEETGMLTITPESYESYVQYETARARSLLEGRLTVHT